MSGKYIEVKLPAWSELPTIELYLDQVLIFVNEACRLDGDAEEKKLTAAMVNNYVKHGHISRPNKKKYNRSQIAHIIAITCLKNVFAIQDIGAALAVMLREREACELYDDFVKYMRDTGEENHDSIIMCACRTIKLYLRTKQLVGGVL